MSKIFISFLIVSVFLIQSFGMNDCGLSLLSQESVSTPGFKFDKNKIFRVYGISKNNYLDNYHSFYRMNFATGFIIKDFLEERKVFDSSPSLFKSLINKVRGFINKPQIPNSFQQTLSSKATHTGGVIEDIPHSGNIYMTPYQFSKASEINSRTSYFHIDGSHEYLYHLIGASQFEVWWSQDLYAGPRLLDLKPVLNLKDSFGQGLGNTQVENNKQNFESLYKPEPSFNSLPVEDNEEDHVYEITSVSFPGSQDVYLMFKIVNGFNQLAGCLISFDCTRYVVIHVNSETLGYKVLYETSGDLDSLSESENQQVKAIYNKDIQLSDEEFEAKKQSQNRYHKIVRQMKLNPETRVLIIKSSLSTGVPLKDIIIPLNEN